MFDLTEWIEFGAREPVLLILLGGIFGGAAFTQLVKLTFLAFTETPVPTKRYRASVRWLAVLSTASTTNWLWLAILAHSGGGLRHAASAVAGVCAPFAYTGAKALVATRWPEFAKHWGDGES